MKRSNRLLILVGVFLAVVAMVGVIVVAGNGNNPSTAKGSPTPTPEPTVTVVIAATDMALGDQITADMVTTETMTVSQRDALGEQTFDSVSEVIGKVAGGTILKGQVLFAGSDFLNPGTVAAGQDLASAVAPGKVAVAMEVDQVNGVGTLIVPGDHVDIILSVWMDQLKITTSGSVATGVTIDVPAPQQVTTKMVIQNRKVLATLLPAPEAAQQGVNTGTTPTPQPQPTAEQITNNGNHMIVIVEVLPDEAEIIRWAQREEQTSPQNYITLSLALRSDQDNDAPAVTTPGITFKQLVTIYGVLPPDPRAIIPPDLAKQISW